MNHRAIREFEELLKNPFIHKQVYEKFPISKSEKKCATEKATMDQLRVNMAKKLYDEMPKEKMEYK